MFYLYMAFTMLTSMTTWHDLRIPEMTPSFDEPAQCSDVVENFRDAKQRVGEAFEHQYVDRLLSTTGGNISAAARMAGLDRSNFRRLLKRTGS